MKIKSQRKCMILALKNSTTGNQNQMIKNRVALHKITGVRRRKKDQRKIKVWNTSVTTRNT